MADSLESGVIKQVQEVLGLYGVVLTPEALKPDAAGKSDYSEVLSKTQDKIDELREQADAIAQKMGMTKEQLEAYSNDPKNFTPEQWELLQKVRQECDAFKQKTVETFKKAGQELVFETKEEKTKTSKRKNWIPS
ncbi:MAG: hypothetical protein JSS62_03275 [Verrucomicrobia bacterium]|nr:hypothetical protein [Verrucomicrobiota bacterium]MBS0646691.1 hypothetical protein [Verrucomicrobiota bacterium]